MIRKLKFVIEELVIAGADNKELSNRRIRQSYLPIVANLSNRAKNWIWNLNEVTFSS